MGIKRDQKLSFQLYPLFLFLINLQEAKTMNIFMACMIITDSVGIMVNIDHYTSKLNNHKPVSLLRIVN